MESEVFKYSDFFQDDGGFEKAKKDLDDFGQEVIKKANDIKSKVKIFDIEDVEGIKKLEKETENITNAFKKYTEAKVDVNKVESEYRKQIKKVNQTNDEQIDKLVKLDSELGNLRTRLKKVNADEKKGIKTAEESSALRVDLTLRIKDLNKEISKNQTEILKSNDLTVKEQKLLKANLVLQRQEIKNRGELRERIAALRVVVDSLDFETQADQIKLYNDEIDGLTDKLSENSDAFIQNKINIGNYEEGVINALKSSNLFQGQLSALNGAVDKLVDFLFASEKANEKDAAAKKVNSRATGTLTKSIRVLNNVAKATVILALVAAIASLAAVFSQGRAGAVATERVLARFTATARVLINVAGEVGKGIIQLFIGIGNSFGGFFDKVELLFLKAQKQFASLPSLLGGSSEKVGELTEQINQLQKSISNRSNENYAKGWDKITTAVGSASSRIDDAKAAIDTLDEGAIRAFEIADEIRKAELALVDLRKEVQLLETESGDSTISLRSQLEATEKLLEKRVELLSQESIVAGKNLELANAKARADAQAAGFRLTDGDDLESQVKFAEELLDLNIRLSERNGENVLNDDFLQQSQDALKEYKTLLGDVEVAEVEIGKQRREIQRDIFEQNLDLLIDLIDTEKNISEQIVNDTTLLFQKRLNEFNDFVVKFRSTTQQQLNEFTKEANNLGLDLDFQIEYDENGDFQVLINDSELAIDNIVELNEQLQATGLNEIDINRFREFIKETRNGVRDFRDLGKEIRQTGIDVKELSENASVSQDELNALDTLQEKIDKLRISSQGRLSASQRDKIIAELEELEKQKSAIEEFASFQRLINQRDAIDAELENVEFESQRYFELLQERLDIEKELRNKNVDEAIIAEKEKNKKIIEEQKKAASETRAIVSSVLDAAIDAQEKRVELTQERVNTQNELVDEQRDRAEAGLSNTLAFEQKELAKRESERIKEEEKKQRLDKIRALYTSYSNYSSQGEGDNAIAKALRDFAVLEAITASFGDGGIVGVDQAEKVRTNQNGITIGRSHNMKKGVLAYHEGGEGFMSRKAIQNIGQDGFRRIHEMAENGVMDKNFFSGQREVFNSVIPVSNGSPELLSEMRQVKKAIESKPVPSWDVVNHHNGTMELIETIKTKNSTKRNHYKLRKPKL